MKKTLLIILALVIVGLGIRYWFMSKPSQPERSAVPTATVPKPAAPSPKPATVAPTPTTEPSAPSATTSSATTPSSAVTPPVVDATWKTYTNAALGFAFDWPTKGRYAPTWEVTFVKENDESMVNGCHTESYANSGSPVNVTLNGFAFCHTSYSDGAAGTMHLIDDYSTKIGRQYVVISFLKAFNNWATPPFDGAAYGAHLDQIISTFRHLP